jgi:hypothetical protein
VQQECAHKFFSTTSAIFSNDVAVCLKYTILRQNPTNKKILNIIRQTMSANLEKSSSLMEEDDETPSSSGSEEEDTADFTSSSEPIPPSPQKQRQVSGQNQIWASVTNPQVILKIHQNIIE